MEDIKIAALNGEEFEKATGLINRVFRTSLGYRPTMEKEFPLLLCRENSSNMIAAQRAEEVIACVNFIPEKIYVNSSAISAASIGAVCTDEKYRGRGISSAVLDMAEEKMLKRGVDVVLISGERSLYTRRGCILVENFIEYEIGPSETKLDCEIIPYEGKYLVQMAKAYNQFSTRYSRSWEEFETLLDSATIEWGNFRYKKYVLLSGGEFAGYIVLRIIGSDSAYGQVIECFASKERAYAALSHLARELSLSHILHYVHKIDSINSLEEYEKGKSCNMHGTIKILSLERLMESLRPYLLENVGKAAAEGLRFEQGNGTYSAALGKEKIEIGSMEDVTNLIFEGPVLQGIGANEESKLCRALSRAFPIPFVWTANLNYQ